MLSRARAVAVAVLALVLLLVLFGPARAESRTAEVTAGKSESSSKSSKSRKSRKKSRASSGSGGCRLQKPQLFLKRPYFVKSGMLQGKRHLRALRYRVEHYGQVNGAGLEALNAQTAYSQAKTVKFFGLPVSIHEKIAPALRCVERRIQKVCKKPSQRYTPRALGGFRQDNTYRGGEVSNHLFGIAIDIDPDRNPCCRCVKPWPDHPLCREPERPIYEKTSLPRCWIQAFERYGFYWLGRDDLEDTMHFEYLGDPDRIEP